MATIVLSAAGFAAGASVGGTVFGLSSAVIGRAFGATVGRVIDQRLLGSGSQAVETGRVERFRLTGASEGAPVSQVYGRMRLPGQVIWASRFEESSTTTGGGKGSRGSTTSFSYSVSLAIALCEGEITRVGRIWADGIEVARDDLNLRLYTGSEDQMPDPKIEAVEGAGNAPSYRGTAYVVLESLPLDQFGNRVPQFTFEVIGAAGDTGISDLSTGIQAVALMPGTGEYALATTPVHYSDGLGQNRSANVNSPSGKTDFQTSVENLSEELPNCGSASLVVSWFGNDLRCGSCEISPKVEQRAQDGVGMAWNVSGIGRAGASEIAKVDGRSIYGGTPADASVVEAVAELTASGKDTVFYPFILMDQLDGNGLPDPWSGADDQPVLPWRGRITLSVAPGRAGSPDQGAQADAEVAAFFGQAAPGDFSVNGTVVSYDGPAEWSYRRFILHYAHLCAAAGGVAAFCIGSEMRGMTQIRGAAGFPVVEALRQLAADVRLILGPETKIGYAADWTEYFGYQPQDGSGDVFFHLDPLWADGNIDFVGIDNYMPLADWRDGNAHADASWGTIYDLEYLKSNIAGGEGFDWYYASPEAEAAQIRTPITDGAHDEPWVYRYKDLKGWWGNQHHERIGGVRQATATGWVPGSKPIWFTELGCAAIDKGPNEPNKFLDTKSSESSLPKYSDGTRDELVQMQYLRAMFEFWSEPDNNPISNNYSGPMVDMGRAHVWAWDARPYPFFPNNIELWSDGENYARGHWINGRTAARALAAVVAEICLKSGVQDFDVSDLYGYVRGYSVIDPGTARAALQPLMLAYGFDAVERDGALIFRTRDGRAVADIESQHLAVSADLPGEAEAIRAPVAEIAGRVRLAYVDAEGDYETRAAEAVFPDESDVTTSNSELSLALIKSEARAITERWLAESRIARDTLRFALPPSQLGIGAGDVVRLGNGDASGLYRLDQVEHTNMQLIEAVRVEPDVYRPSDGADEAARVRAFAPAVPPFPVFLDLPLLTGDEAEHAPHLAVTSQPWPGRVAVYASNSGSGYEQNTIITAPSTIGVTQSVLEARGPGVWDRGGPLRVKLSSGALAAASQGEVLNGANVAAIGDGSSDNWEIFQFAGATLVAPDTYDLTLRLRGQQGSDALIPQVWPEGSIFVLLDGVPGQIELAPSARNLARHYRIGPARRALDDPSYVEKIEAFSGIGLRPYSPAHLRIARGGTGDLAVSWVRRTRIDGDSWVPVDVPLGEAIEQYLVRVIKDGAVLRETTTAAPQWSYSAAQQAADGATGALEIKVAQLSDRYGAGLFERIMINV